MRIIPNQNNRICIIKSKEGREAFGLVNFINTNNVNLKRLREI
jgi:hypothetical protein